MGQYFINSINSSKYKHESINRHVYLTQNLEQIIEKIIESNKFDSNFKVHEAKQELLKLVNAKNTLLKNKTQKTFFHQNNQMKQICNNILRLWDSYSKNHRIIHLTLSSAKNQSLLEEKKQHYYIEQTSITPEQNIFQVPSSLSFEEYRNIINKENSEFAKQLLKKNFPGNITEEQFNASLTQARNINKSKQNSQEENSSMSDSEEFNETAADLEHALQRLDVLQRNNFCKKLPNAPKTKIARSN